MKLLIPFFLIVFFCSCSEHKTQILLVTGGHNFDTAEFFNVFDSLDKYQIDRKAQPEANEFIASAQAAQYNLIIFYDMWENISEKQQKGYLSLTDKGIPLLFLHHSIVSYQDWDEFRKILGGKYIQPAVVTDSSLLSHYKHDILLNVHIIDPENPVTKGLTDFEITDEGYSNFAVEQDIKPILSTKHPDSGEIIGWTRKYRNSKIVYIMLGHDKKAYANKNFQTLIKNSIGYLMNSKQ